MGTSLVDYYDMLAKHDWHYEYADDFRVWTSGAEERRRIMVIAGEDDRHAALYATFRDFYAGRSSVKPARPEVG